MERTLAETSEKLLHFGSDSMKTKFGESLDERLARFKAWRIIDFHGPVTRMIPRHNYSSHYSGVREWLFLRMCCNRAEVDARLPSSEDFHVICFSQLLQRCLKLMMKKDPSPTVEAESLAVTQLDGLECSFGGKQSCSDLGFRNNTEELD